MSTTYQRRKTSFKFCTGVMVLKKCQKDRRERRCSKDGWPKHKNEGKRPIHSKFWPKPLWLSMVLDWGLPAQISRNLEKILSFVNFLCQLQVFPVSRPRTARGRFEGLLGIVKTWHFWKGHAKRKITSTREKLNFEIWASKSSKYIKKMTFCPLFELQKVTLGEMVFEGEKQLQIQKFHLGWKVDRPSFPMSHLALDLDQWNPLKICCKGARTWEPGARTWELTLPELTFLVKKHCFDYGWLFLLVYDG